MIPVVSDAESLSTPGADADTTVSDGAEPDETGETESFGALADPHRRAVLRYLADNESPVALAELADHLTIEREGGDRDAAHPSSRLAEWGDALLGTRRRVQISLRHVHVPKLADAGAVDFDIDANTVSLRDRGSELLAQTESLESATVA
ncbi:DUF7344 domain-containing protein [Halopiger aswanensis]|uniref:DUF7344 domain-containing protein n=1 Tax=Halopiger aswanensis TaxID=148449 RepID=A0A419WGI1_9EURY|nr:helix-turn-helix transcriptional regulator [Halopiger aswanensis]RKD94621.1 hypothetical protein ATJ93_1456 [Halopiger aswanensis]